MQKSLIVGTLVRHALTAVGAIAVTGGFGTGAEWEQIAGGVGTLAAVVLSVINKKRLTQ